MPIKAIGYKILIKPDGVEEKSKGGIFLAVDKKMEQNAQTVGTIVDIGEDAFVAYKPKTPFCGLKPGDRVYYAKYAGKWCKDPKTEEEFLMVVDDDICGKYEDGDSTTQLAS